MEYRYPPPSKVILTVDTRRASWNSTSIHCARPAARGRARHAVAGSPSNAANGWCSGRDPADGSAGPRAGRADRRRCPDTGHGRRQSRPRRDVVGGRRPQARWSASCWSAWPTRGRGRAERHLPAAQAVGERHRPERPSAAEVAGEHGRAPAQLTGRGEVQQRLRPPDHGRDAVGVVRDHAVDSPADLEDLQGPDRDARPWSMKPPVGAVVPTTGPNAGHRRGRANGRAPAAPRAGGSLPDAP